MEELLPYYERELALLRVYSREFAARYPKIAARLTLTEEVSDDPHVERMIEAFALLSARINKKLDDDYPEFTEALLESLHPHYLRPFPSCSIAQFAVRGSLAHLTEPQLVKRGTQLKSHEQNGVHCRFRSAYDVLLAPLCISEARFSQAASAPVALSPRAAAVLSVTIETTSPKLGLDAIALKLPSLRVHLHGEQSMAAALVDSLHIHALAAYVESDARPGYWHALASLPFEPAGLAPEDALLDESATAHPAYRLLTEYFGFIEKFNFVDFDLRAMLKAVGPCRRVTLHIVLNNALAQPNMARLIESVSAEQFRLFCTPVVNLFRQPGEPVTVTHQAVSYPVVADSRHASAYDVYSIDAVRLVRNSVQGQTITEFKPIYALRHADAAQAGHYWYARRDDDLAHQSPGFETNLTLIDIDFNPIADQTDALSIELTCTNRDMPTRLTVGLESGDLFIDGGSLPGRIAMLRRPTPSLRHPRARAAHWRLISSLVLNQVPLASAGGTALKEILTLHDMRRDAVSARQIAGIVDVEQRAVIEWLPGKPFATFVRGAQLRVTIDDDHFVGTGLASFVRVIDTFLGLYVHLNAFVQLVVVSKNTGEEIVKCRPRSGESALV